MKRVFAAITQLSLRFKWVTILIAAAALAAGVWAATKMNQELLPNISFPQTFIVTLQTGASSEDLRDLVTLPLEAELIKIKGVVPEGLQTTTTSPVAFMNVVNESGIAPAMLRAEIQKAIDGVVAVGVPQGLKTTADLTPEILTKVLTKAPSMWKHFESSHLLALPPAVLDAAFKLDPSYAKSLDPLVRDQLASERVDAARNGTKIEKRAVPLPGAWIITSEKLPRILTFDLSSLPVVTSNISSAKLSQDQLRELVETELKPALLKVLGVPDGGVSVSGGQVIPPEVMAAAESAVTAKIAANLSPAPAAATAQATAAATMAPTAAATTPATPAATAAATTVAAANTSANPPAASGSADTAAVDPNSVPLAPPAWRNFLTQGIINTVLKTQVNNADDLFKAKDATGASLTAAAALSLLADKNANLVRDLSPEFVQYVAGKEPDFLKNLTPAGSAALSAAAYAALANETPAPVLGGPWATLLQQTGFKVALVTTARDLLTQPGGAAATLNSIVKATPDQLNSFSVRLINGLSPEAVTYILKYEPDFLTKLDPTVVRYFSSDALKAIPAATLQALPDEKLRADLAAIIADPSKSAYAQLGDAQVGAAFVDDPNAPALASNWATIPGMTLKTANDLLKKPFGLTAGGFINAVANSPQGGGALIRTLTPEVLLYLQTREPTFFNTLTPATLALFPKETLAKLPKEVADRAEATPFVATNTVTRSNGNTSLTLSVSKEPTANTVNVADAVDEVFKEFTTKHPDIAINTAFEQASFIKESISGVAREGGLGAVMAVIVILLFLNFSFRSTLVTAVSIPTSVGIAFVFMYLIPQTLHPLVLNAGLPESLKTVLLRLFPASITLNIMTLSGLTVAIGRVVDDSIVVLENIYRQIQATGDTRRAVLQGTRDVSLAIFAATVTTVVVFLPIGLTGGIIGEFFLPFGLAVTYSLLASFVVAITIVPVLAFLFIRTKDVPDEKEGRLEHIYQAAIGWSLSHRWIVLAIALVTLVLGIGLFGTRPTTFLPSFGEPQVSVTVSLPTGTPIQQTDVYVRKFENYVKSDLLGKQVTKFTVSIGGGGGLASLIGGSGITGSAATITLVPSVKGDALTTLTGDVRVRAEQVFGQKFVKVSKASLSEQGFGGFALVASGPADLLAKYDAEIIKTLSTVPGLANVSSTISQAAGSSSTTYLRINLSPAVQYSGELETSDTLGTTRKAIAAVKANKNLPSEITIGEGYQSQQQTQGFAQTFGSLGLAILIVYIVMVITFGSLVHPFTILFSLPLAVVGAALGLTITNRVVGISALIGLLMLVGIVVTNAIVLIDRVQANRKERKMPVREALVEGGKTRLRPILMTAIATMIALLPLAIGLSEGAIIAAELGTVVIGGLFSSTLLTLLVVPVIYSMFNAVTSRIMRQGDRAK